MYNYVGVLWWFSSLRLIRLLKEVQRAWVVGWGLDEFFIFFSFFFHGEERDQLTKDKKWTVNTLNKAQQEQEPAFSLSLSPCLSLTFSLSPSLSLSLSLPLSLFLSPSPPLLSTTTPTKGGPWAYKVPINTECLPLAPPSVSCWQLWCLG